MYDIMTVQGVECYELDGTAYLKLEAVARGLGFTQEKNGVEYVKWERVSAYLRDFGFSPEVGKDTYIPENIFYRLAMKAKNAAAEKFQAKVADEIIPEIRRTGRYVANAPTTTRMLTVDDYLTAAKLIATCRNERLPYIFGVLKQLGMEIKPATPPLLEAKNREMLQLKSEEEHRYRELADYFIENCDTLGRLKQFGLFYYACVPTTTAREVALKCKVDYRGFLRWARFCGLLREDGHGYSMSVRFGKTARHCICIKLTDDNKGVM